MAQKDFAKVISTHSGDLLVQKTYDEKQNQFGLSMTIVTDKGTMANVQHNFSNAHAVNAHYKSITKETAKQFIFKTEERLRTLNK